MRMLCGFSSECLKTSRDFSPLFENTMKLSCYFIVILNDRPPSMFPLYLGVYIFHYSRSKLMSRPILVLNWPEKSIILSARYVSVAMPYVLCLTLSLGRIWNSIPSSNFAYSATIKPRSSADFIDMKISVLPPTQRVFTVIEHHYKCQPSFKSGITSIIKDEIVFFINQNLLHFVPIITVFPNIALKEKYLA